MSGEPLTALYHPITSVPFQRDGAYAELAPCEALRPYIRCFWGTTAPVQTAHAAAKAPRLVIPDTCMDLIFRLDYGSGTVSGCFCAMDEEPYFVPAAGGEAVSTFAIRFYAWTAALFAECSLAGSKNQSFGAEVFCRSLQNQLLPMLMSVETLRERAEAAGRYLLGRLEQGRINGSLMAAVYDVVRSRGTMKIAELAAGNALSGKRLERLFDESMGLSPKAFSSLVRYQMLWQELCGRESFDILDLTEKYGYFDQAHLLHDFKRRHGMTPSQAVSLARG